MHWLSSFFCHCYLTANVSNAWFSNGWPKNPATSFLKHHQTKHPNIMVFFWLSNNTRKEWLQPQGHQTCMVWQDGFTLEPFVWLGTIFSRHLFQAAWGHQSLQKYNCRILWWPPCSECILWCHCTTSCWQVLPLDQACFWQEYFLWKL